MPFVVKTNKGYIKRTSRFGPFYGSIVLTEDIGDAFKFSRQQDAERRANTVKFRTKEEDDEGKWYSKRGYDYDKFGGALTCGVMEV